MKILIINYRFQFTGGPERYMFNIISELEARGHETIHFSTINPNNEFSRYSGYFARNVGNSQEYLFENYKKNLSFYWDYLNREFYSIYIKSKLKKLLVEYKPDICYLLPHKVPLSVSVIDILYEMNIPIVHRVSDYNIICGQTGMYRDRKFCNLCKKNPVEIIKNKCINNSYIHTSIRYLSGAFHRKMKIYEKINHFIFTNDFAKDQFIDFGFPSNKMTVLRTFSNEIIRVSKTLKYSPIKIISVGNIDDSKGTFDILQALFLLKKRGINSFQLGIYGGLRHLEIQKTKELISRYGLENEVTLYGKIEADKILDVYKNADLTIIAARWVENLPNVLVESLSSGTPVIAPNFGSFKAVLDSSVSFFFKPYDVQSLSNLLYEINKKPDLIAKKSEVCYNFAKTNFDKTLHLDSLLKLFKKIVYENS